MIFSIFGAYLDVWTHGNCKLGYFENSIFRNREVQTILEIGQFCEILALCQQWASRRGFFPGANSIPGTFRHVFS